MTNDTNSLVPLNYFLEPGYIYMTRNPTVISTVLGSDVSVCLYDKKRKVGGMNRYQYPSTTDKLMATAKYGNVAIIALIRMMIEDGSQKKHLEAQILGGAHNSEISQMDIGYKNIAVAKRILSKEQINIASEDVGGQKGRKIVFNTGTSEVAVIKVEKLRNSDWFNHQTDPNNP